MRQTDTPPSPIPRRRLRAAWGTIVLAAALVGAPASVRARPATGGSRANEARPRAVVLDVRGSADEATALRATLQELTSRRGLPCVFTARDARAGLASPWATLSFELEGDGPTSAGRGPALTLREGAGGRLRLHRVLPGGASSAVTIETLATIASTALETLAREEFARPATPRERAEPAPARALGDRAPLPEATPTPVPETPPAASLDSATTPTPPPPATMPTTTEAQPALVSPSPDRPRPADEGGDATLVVARASAPVASATPSPLRLSLTSFTGYRTGNTLTADRLTEGAWGMGVGVVGALLRWPLEPALGVGFGTWYGTGHDHFGSGTTSDGGPRPAAGPQLQGQAELRLTVVRQGRLSGALGPWLTVSRATTDFGPTTPPAPRAPGSNQGQPPVQGQDPGAGYGATSVTRTDVSAGLAARLEVLLGGRLSLYLTLAGTTPLTSRPVAGDGRPPPNTPNGSGQGQFESTTIPRWTASAFAGLSIAFTGSPPAL